MRLLSRSALLLAAAVLALSGCAPTGRPSPRAKPKPIQTRPSSPPVTTWGLEGKPAPEIRGEDIDGKFFKLSEYRGKVVLLDFWGNW